MRAFKGIFFFIIAFILACVVLLTFMQEPFQVKVGAKLLWYQTQAIPVYWYLIGAFTLGILFGFVVFIYYYTQQSLTLHERNKEIREQAAEIEALRSTLRETSAEQEQLKNNKVASEKLPPTLLAGKP